MAVRPEGAEYDYPGDHYGCKEAIGDLEAAVARWNPRRDPDDTQPLDEYGPEDDPC